MKYLLLIILLTGCSISNEEIVKRTNYCKENKLYPLVQFNGFTMNVVDVICLPYTTAKALVGKETFNEYLKSLEEIK